MSTQSLTQEIKYGQYDVPTSDKCACLNVGQPRSNMLPLVQYKNAMLRVLERSDPSILQYGKIQGYDMFRQELANFLSHLYQHLLEESLLTNDLKINVNPSDLVITNGNTGAVHLLLSLYAKTNTTIFVEDPTYFLMLDSFKELGLNIKPIKMESDGIDINELATLLENEDKLKNCILYTIPFYHNPTGYSMSENKKNRLTQLLTTYPNLIVISDEVYHFLKFNQTNQTDQTNMTEPNKKSGTFPLCCYHENIISLGSFSKIFSPALRLGWIYTLNKSILNKIINCGQLDSSGNVNPLSCAIMHELILGGELLSVIQMWKNFLAHNCTLLHNALVTILGNDIESVEYPKGGYFVWVKFKPYVDTVELSKQMETYHVKFHHGNKFSYSKTSSQYMRLSFSWYDNELDYTNAMNRLKLLIDENHSETTVSNNDQYQNIQVFVHGHTGKLGSLITMELEKTNGFEYSGHIDRSLNLQNITSKHVIVDTSMPEGTTNLLTKLLELKIYCPIVIGTTGNLPTSLITEYSKFSPVVISSNFSKGIVQMKKIIDSINKNMWTASLSESHHTAKKDAPSGTAKTLANHYGPDLIPHDSIDSIREGKIIGEHHLLLDSPDEFITISHVAKTRQLFASGSLEWIKWIGLQPNGIYTSM